MGVNLVQLLAQSSGFLSGPVWYCWHWTQSLNSIHLSEHVCEKKPLNNMFTSIFIKNINLLDISHRIFRYICLRRWSRICKRRIRILHARSRSVRPPHPERNRWPLILYKRNWIPSSHHSNGKHRSRKCRVLDRYTTHHRVVRKRSCHIRNIVRRSSEKNWRTSHWEQLLYWFSYANCGGILNFFEGVPKHFFR